MSILQIVYFVSQTCEVLLMSALAGPIIKDISYSAKVGL